MVSQQLGDEFSLLWKNLQQAKDDIERIKSQLLSIASGGRVVSTSIVGTVPATPAPVIQYFVNNSGGALNEGDVVVLDMSSSRIVNTTATAANVLAVGVVRDFKSAAPYAIGAETPVLLLGNAPTIKVTGTVAAGDYLTSSTSAGRAESAGAAVVAGAFALAETANPSGDGTVIGFVIGLGAGVGSGGSMRFYVPFGSEAVDGET